MSELVLGAELSDGTLVSIYTTAPLTAETFGELKGYVEVYERVLKKRAAANAMLPAVDLVPIANESGSSGV